MKRVLLLVVAAIAAFLLIGASQLTIQGTGHATMQVAGPDDPGGG